MHTTGHVLKAAAVVVAAALPHASAFQIGAPRMALGFQRTAIVKHAAERRPYRHSVSMVASTDFVQASPVQKPLPDYTGWTDLSKPPPFTLKDIQEAIPAKCWEKDVGKSMSYLFKDVALVFAALAIAVTLDNPFVWPVYWLVQGTLFWSLFVVGHDCGHGSFSNNKFVNDLIGHITHSSIMVPYHGWRISHRTHHSNHGHVENDESWYPTTEAKYREMTAPDGDVMTKLGSWVRFSVLGNLLAFPLYLWNRSPGRTPGSHYDWTFTQDKKGPGALFKASESTQIFTSTACLVGMLGILAAVGGTMGLPFLLKTYVAPYIVGVAWLDLVTYLHHTDKELPWYRDPEWTYMRGGLSTTDRDYGVLNKIHHDIGTHVVHHLFPQMPHYNLCEATEAVKPLLGPYYREPEKSGFLPLHLIRDLFDGVRNCVYVKDNGSIVYYRNHDGVVTSSDGGARREQS